MTQTNAKPGISIVVEPDWTNDGRDLLVILDRHPFRRTMCLAAFRSAR